MKNIVMLLLSLFLVGCSDYGGTSSEVNTGKMIGNFVTKEGIPVHNATVELLLSSGEDDTGTVVKVTTTNLEGAYEFDSLESGLYTVAGSYADSLYGSRHNITHIDTADTDLSEDTLFAPGFIKGVVKLEGSNLYGVQVFVPGTSISAFTGIDGAFIIDNVPPNGDYSLAFQKHGYLPTILNGITVLAGDTTVLDTVTLIRNLYPKGLTATFDTTTGNISLQWNRHKESTFGYVIYRNDTTRIGEKLKAIKPEDDPCEDTVYLDTLFRDLFDIRDTIVLEYCVRSVDADGSISAKSNSVYVNAHYIPDPTDIAGYTISFPTAIDTLKGGSRTNIEWSHWGKVSPYVVILFSPDKGNRWYRQVTACENKGYYLWDVPNITSDSCLIEIFDYDQKESLGRSELFSVHHNKEQNLLKNSQFDEGTKYWRLYPFENASGEFIVDAGVAQVTNLVKMDLGWKLPLLQDSITLQLGGQYKLDFEAKSSLATQELPVCILNDKPTPTLYCLNKFIITSEWDHYSLDFTMEHVDDLNSILHISFAESLSVVQLDNFVLKRID